MKSMNVIQTSRQEIGTDARYPILSLAVAMALLFLVPFVSSLLSYVVFLICVYRVVRYDSRVFVADYCVLVPVSLLFQTPGGMSLLVYLSLLAGIWYFIKSGIRADASYILLIVLMNYLITRMQLQITNYVLCFGQLFILCVLLPMQDDASAERAIRAFCVSLMLSSAYALVFRNTWQIQALRGVEVAAFWGSNIKRFQGLYEDPNYYMYLLIIGLALLMKLRDSNRIQPAPFWIVAVCMTGFGILTYSKTFFLVFVLLGCVYIVWQFWNKKIFWGMFVTIAAGLAAGVLLFWEGSPFSVVLTRLTSADGISELTTGRTDIFVKYLEAIFDSPASFLFGAGLAAENLGMDPHNLFLEIAYYIGVVGLVLILLYFAALIHVARERAEDGPKQNLISKYVVLMMVFVLHCTLHGMFSLISYAGFFLAFLSSMLTKKKEET